MSSPTRERIAAATLEILATDGSNGVTIRAVAARAQVSPMAIYRHYADREALVTAVADSRFDELAADWEAKPHQGEPTALIEESLSSLLDFALREPRVYDCLFLEPRPRARRYPAGFASGASPTFSILVGLVEQAMAEGALRQADPMEVSLGLAAVVHGLVQLARGGRVSLPESEFRQLCMRSIRRMLDGIGA